MERVGIMAKDSIDKGADAPEAVARYDDELLCANWNPVIALLESSCARTADAARDEAPHISGEDVNDFLGRIYSAGA